MLSGHVQQKKGRFYMVLNLRDDTGKWKPKWIATGLPIKGNKRRAEEMLRAKITEYELADSKVNGDSDKILFTDFMKEWLLMRKSSLEETTYSSYYLTVVKSVCPYFEPLKLTLRDIEKNPQYIQKYYSYLTNERGLKGNSVRRHHANIRKALQHAFKTDLIASNPADKVDKPKVLDYPVTYYSTDELNQLFSLASDSKIFLIIVMAAFYGLRRSEVLGLKWRAIDFKKKTISISHTVTNAIDDETGKLFLVQKDRTKNKSSHRSLPLVSEVEFLLLERKKQNKEFRKLCGNCYTDEYAEYVFVDELGFLHKPNYVTRVFTALLKDNELTHIRFHDLRHPRVKLGLKNIFNFFNPHIRDRIPVFAHASVLQF